VSTALSEPVERIGKAWTASLSLANVAIWVGWYAPLQILPARQAEDFAPGTGMSKETLLARPSRAGPGCIDMRLPPRSRRAEQRLDTDTPQATPP
jgi:hypothetical protein